MAAHYRAQVARLVAAFRDEANRTEAAEIIRWLENLL
jgi:hypothetical protein